MSSVSPTLLGPLAALLLTPMVMAFWAKLSPVREVTPSDALSDEELKRRNSWIDNSFTVLMFVGLAGPALPLMSLAPYGQSIWLLGALFGSMVLLPTVFVALVTLRQGWPRFAEFWRYYEKRWGIGISGIAVVYGLIGFLGVVSYAVILVGHLTTRVT